MTDAVHRDSGPPEAIDRRQLLDAAGGDPELAVELVGILADDARRLLAGIDAATAAGDVAAVRSAAHSLKGSALTLGHVALGEAARSLEASAASGDIPADRVSVLRALVGAIEPPGGSR
jgi:two-component system sensor histidine kinase/response regulator